MIIVLTTIGKKTQAQKLAKVLIKKKLAGCVNIIKIEKSTYRWNGKIVEDREFLLLIKSTRDYRTIEQFLIKHHPYELPEIIALPIGKGYKAYLKWLAGECK